MIQQECKDEMRLVLVTCSSHIKDLVTKIIDAQDLNIKKIYDLKYNILKHINAARVSIMSILNEWTIEYEDTTDYTENCYEFAKITIKNIDFIKDNYLCIIDYLFEKEGM